MLPVAGGLPCFGGVRKKTRKRGNGGSLSSASLEPQWLARIQPHCAFDEGWMLELNQSHMSPAETEARSTEIDRGGGGTVPREEYKTGER